MLRPGQLLALHRRGLLLSSFHPMSHLSGTSSITTRAINQFPAAGLSPAGHAALRAANRDHRDRAENSVFLCALCITKVSYLVKKTRYKLNRQDAKTPRANDTRKSGDLGIFHLGVLASWRFIRIIFLGCGYAALCSLWPLCSLCQSFC